MAEMALTSILNIIIEIEKAPQLVKYSKMEKVNKRMPGYQVKLGFGLHLGWAIEGAIGSNIKIDASYLSANVSMASKLEETTKTYGVPLLFSDSVYDLLSDSTAEMARLIDRVSFNRSDIPVDLYTISLKHRRLNQLETENQQSLEEQKIEMKRTKHLLESLIASI